MQHQNKKTSTTVKEPLSASESFSKKIVQYLLKNINWAYFTTDVGCWVFNSIRERNLHDVG